MPPLAEIASLEPFSLAELRILWVTSFGSAPILRSPDLLRLILAWRLQAKAEGGSIPPLRRKLKRTGPVLAEGLELGCGAKLTREWQGQTEEVSSRGWFPLEAASFYPSLSAVALAMTGTRRNGPRFFGLRGEPT